MDHKPQQARSDWALIGFSTIVCADTVLYLDTNGSSQLAGIHPPKVAVGITACEAACMYSLNIIYLRIVEGGYELDNDKEKVVLDRVEFSRFVDEQRKIKQMITPKPTV